MKKVIKIIFYSVFVVYCLALVKVLLIDGRSASEDSIGYFFTRSNFIPFRSVFDYVKKLFENRINPETVLRNIIGNLIVLFPMGCFLPCLFKPFQKYKNTFLLCFAIVLLVEFLQPILRIGFLDIDDFIFNLAGAGFGYLTVQIPFVKKTLIKCSVYAH